MYSLVYDDGCGPCTRFRDAVALLDSKRRMRFMGLDQADGEGKLDPVPPEGRRSSFHLVAPDGSVWSGSRAIPRVAALLPAGGALEAALGCPPVRSFVGFGYSALSRLHSSATCGSRSGTRGNRLGA